WKQAAIADDPVTHSNLAGTITFAAAGRNTRTTEVFINLRDNARLDKAGFAPFGVVVEGLATARELDGDYGDTPPNGHGPDPGQIARSGAAYLTRNFPRLDVIYSARVLAVGSAQGGYASGEGGHTVAASHRGVAAAR